MTESTPDTPNIAEAWNHDMDGPFPYWLSLTVEQKLAAESLHQATFNAGRDFQREHAEKDWEPLGEGTLHIGDEARCVEGDLATSGIVARLDEDGDPFTAEGHLIGRLDTGVWSVRRALVTYHRLPTEGSAHITKALIHEDTCDYMALNHHGFWVGVDQNGTTHFIEAARIDSCILQDGTAVMRNGTFENNEPRFLEVPAEKKE